MSSSKQHLGFISNRDFLTGNNDVEAINAAIAAAEAAGGCEVRIAPNGSDYTAAEGEVIRVPDKVVLNMNDQRIAWTDNRADVTAHLFRIDEGGQVTNGRVLCAGTTGTGGVIYLTGSEVFSRDLKTAFSNLSLQGNAQRTHTAIYGVADGTAGDQYINWVRGHAWVSNFKHALALEASNGSVNTVYINGNDFDLKIDSTLIPLRLHGDSNDVAIDRNNIRILAQAIPSTTRLATLERASENEIHGSWFDWSESGEDTAVDANAGSVNNIISLRVSNADPTSFIGGVNAADNEFVDRGLPTYPAPGMIRVSTPIGVRKWRTPADGVNDDRDVINAAVQFARLNVPFKMEFGPGVYTQNDGYSLTFPAGTSGIHISGMGAATEFKFSGGLAVTPSLSAIFDIKPTTTPATEADYLDNVVVENMKFSDDDPATHGGGSEETHGVQVRYAKNVLVRNTTCDSIGDEGITFSRVIQGVATENNLINTPADGTAGAGINVGLNCRDVSVYGNNFQATATEGTQTAISNASAVTIAVVGSLTGSPQNAENVSVYGNNMRDYVHGVFMNVAETGQNSNISNVQIFNNNMSNCVDGVRLTGAHGIHSRVKITGNIIDNPTGRAVHLDTTKDRIVDCSVSGNTINNATTAGIQGDATRLTMRGNDISNTVVAINMQDSIDAVVEGGVIDNCGDIGRVAAILYGTQVRSIVRGVTLSNCPGNGEVIDGVETIDNCNAQYATVTASDFGGEMFDNVKVATNNTLNGGITPATVADVQISNNVIRPGMNGGIALWRSGIRCKSGVASAIISNNIVDTTGASQGQVCVQVDAGANNVVVSSNTLNSIGTEIGGTPALDSNNTLVT